MHRGRTMEPPHVHTPADVEQGEVCATFLFSAHESEYVLSKLSVNRNTHKTRLGIDSFMKMCAPISGSLILYFPCRQWFLVFARTVLNRTNTNNKNQLYCMSI